MSMARGSGVDPERLKGEVGWILRDLKALLEEFGLLPWTEQSGVLVSGRSE